MPAPHHSRPELSSFERPATALSRFASGPDLPVRPLLRDSAAMLLVPTPSAAGKTDAQAEKLLRRLDGLLPDHWIIAGNIPSKAVTDSGRRGRTRPLDAIIIADKTIFVLDVRSHSGLISVRDKSPFQADGADIDDKANLPDGFWASFQKEAYKLKVLLKERFDIDTIRVAPKMIWARSQRFDYGDSRREDDVTDARTFARLAVRRDKASSLPPFPKDIVAAIAKFLMDDQSLVFDGKATEPSGGDEPTPDRAERVRELTEAEWTPVKAVDDKPAEQTHGADLKLGETAAKGRPVPRWLWLVALVLLTSAVAALLYSRSGPSRLPASPPPQQATQPARPAAHPPAQAPAPVVERFAAPQSFVVGSAPVTVRSGPGPDFPTVGELAAGAEVNGTGTSRGPGGSTWVAISQAAGATGFVPDGMVVPKPVAAPPSAETPSAPAKSPAPAAERRKTERKAERRTEPNRPPRRRSQAKAAAPSGAPATIACILPSGEEIRTSYATCRARSGVIYR
jgi:uncharacterized protein YraI